MTGSECACDTTTFRLLPASLCAECKLPGAVVPAPPRTTVAPVWSDAAAAVEAGRSAHGYGGNTKTALTLGRGDAALGGNGMPACLCVCVCQRHRGNSPL